MLSPLARPKMHVTCRWLPRPSPLGPVGRVCVTSFLSTRTLVRLAWPGNICAVLPQVADPQAGVPIDSSIKKILGFSLEYLLKFNLKQHSNKASLSN